MTGLWVERGREADYPLRVHARLLRALGTMMMEMRVGGAAGKSHANQHKGCTGESK